jgi:hypothetical protein
VFPPPQKELFVGIRGLSNSFLQASYTFGPGIRTSFFHGLPEELLDDPVDLRGGNRLF